MPSPISSQSNTRAGLCPHGLPPAACPICSSGGMGSAGKMKNSPVPKQKSNSGEWSYMKCYAAGLAMKAQQNRVEFNKSAFERQIEFAKQLNKSIENLARKIQNALQNIKDITPKFISNPIQFIANSFINLISQIPKIIEKFAQLQQDIRAFINQAAEKLVSVLGEIKNFIDKKITENIKKKLKKFLIFFKIGVEEENYKNDETLSIFKSNELRKYIVKILIPIKKRNENEHNNTENN